MKNKKNQSFQHSKAATWLLGSGVLLTAVAMTACSSSPTPNYYTISPKITPAVSSSIRVIEVLPVGLPDRLDRAPLVLQDSNGKSTVLDNERWTSTMSTQLRDTLSAGLQQKLGAIDSYSSGLAGNNQPLYRVSTDFSHFDIVDKSDINIAVSWVVKRQIPPTQLESNNAKVITNAGSQLNCRIAFKQPIDQKAKKLEAIVNASSEAMTQIINTVSASIVALDSNKKPVINNGVCS
ncbi:membrane integrity-associated transporter subunit PqiC [Acinetobacter baumannii]|uniref:PqiC family protein n=1 Tax=Acinetobacter baumannii TaxID=470 RepID=UPI0038B52048